MTLLFFFCSHDHFLLSRFNQFYAVAPVPLFLVSMHRTLLSNTMFGRGGEGSGNLRGKKNNNKEWGGEGMKN